MLAVTSVPPKSKVADFGNGWAFLLTAILGALLSIVTTGYLYAVGNNVFHLPILASLYNEPQFQSDQFIQSLRFYAAGPWQALAGADRVIDPYYLFAILLFLSRLVCFLGFLACATLVNIISLRERLIFTVTIALCSPMHGLSLAGGGGLFIPEFTHSEVANGLTLLMLYFMVRKNLFWAIVFNALVFFTNAFFAVWNAVPLVVLALYFVGTKQITAKKALRDTALGLLPAAAIALPVILNVLRNPQYGHPLPVDYAVFLTEYWPLHFFIWANSWGAKFGLAVVALAGLWAMVVLRPRIIAMELVFWSYIFVYCAGAIMPLMTHSPAILNLHLLRSSTCLHLLASLALATLITRWLTSLDMLKNRVLGPLLFLAVCSVRFAMPLAFIPLLIGSRPLDGSTLRRHPVAIRAGQAIMATLLVAAWAFNGRQEVRKISADSAAVRNWAAIGEWARSHTSIDAEFLLADHGYQAHGAGAPSLSRGHSSVRIRVSSARLGRLFARSSSHVESLLLRRVERPDLAGPCSKRLLRPFVLCAEEQD